MRGIEDRPAKYPWKNEFPCDPACVHHLNVLGKNNYLDVVGMMHAEWGRRNLVARCMHLTPKPRTLRQTRA